MKSRWMKKNHYKILNKHLFSINKSDNFFFFCEKDFGNFCY